VDGIVRGALTLLADDRILAEYRNVLGRPRFKIPVAHRNVLLDYLDQAAERVSALPLSTAVPDPDDLCLLEVAVAAQAESLVTGNIRHFPEDRRFGILVETPAQFTERWASLVTPNE
jgi:predicted nucleic acid-binding protein